MDAIFWTDLGERALFAWMCLGPACFALDLAMPEAGTFFRAIGMDWDND
jgi:hypothetical protein